MKLHKDFDAYEELGRLTARYYRIPVLAVRKDYYITILLNVFQRVITKTMSSSRGGIAK